MVFKELAYLFINLNHLAVFSVAILGMAIGFLWYGPLFGKLWMKLAKITKRDIAKAKKKGMGKQYSLAFLSTYLMSYIMGVLVVAVEAVNLIEGIILGVLVWAGFIATSMLSNVLWSDKPLKLYALDTLHYLVVLVSMGAVLAVWA